MNQIVIGKRIPVGAAVTGLVTFGGDFWNTLNPEMALSTAAWGGLAAALTALVQIIVVNVWGVTNVRTPES